MGEKKKTKKIPLVGETRWRNISAICGHLGHNKSTCPSRTTTSDMEIAQARRHKKGKNRSTYYSRMSSYYDIISNKL